MNFRLYGPFTTTIKPNVTVTSNLVSRVWIVRYGWCKYKHDPIQSFDTRQRVKQVDVLSSNELIVENE